MILTMFQPGSYVKSCRKCRARANRIVWGPYTKYGINPEEGQEWANETFALLSPHERQPDCGGDCFTTPTFIGGDQ